MYVRSTLTLQKRRAQRKCNRETQIKYVLLQTRCSAVSLHQDSCLSVAYYSRRDPDLRGLLAFGEHVRRYCLVSPDVIMSGAPSYQPLWTPGGCQAHQQRRIPGHSRVSPRGLMFVRLASLHTTRRRPKPHGSPSVRG
ncbi:hypothetical protein BD311DRAFT_102982 [Dichomitus squalens]|uniref:Uncharacterized protein n=2 Tax=Dichomitus squalens TaxID=114155 RepID=A0A4Q9MY73_9APHY|nr:hypothetical protein BD311DRAFT_102982 [Dichomitus squalens]